MRWKDRNAKGGGIALSIKNNISYSERNDLSLGLETIELISICVEINKGHCRPFLLSAYYRLPNSEIGLFDNIEVLAQSSPTIIGKFAILNVFLLMSFVQTYSK